MFNEFTKTETDDPIIHDGRDENGMIVVDDCPVTYEDTPTIITSNNLYRFPRKTPNE